MSGMNFEQRNRLAKARALSRDVADARELASYRRALAAARAKVAAERDDVFKLRRKIETITGTIEFCTAQDHPPSEVDRRKTRLVTLEAGLEKRKVRLAKARENVRRVVANDPRG